MTEFQILNNSTTGQSLSSGWYYVTADTVCSSSIAGTPGITIGSNDVKIYIKSGCSLTVNGGVASNEIGAGAGIYLSTGSLYFYGNGYLTVNGGNAANGGDPFGGGTDGTNYWNNAGGIGGGGAGAAIGTNGGNGGNNGTTKGTNITGNTTGEDGGNGLTAEAYNGNLYIAYTINANLVGGTAGNAGVASTSSITEADSTHYYFRTAVDGGNGGGKGASIGTGGFGGAQAGNGGGCSGSTSTITGGSNGTNGINGDKATMSNSMNIGYFIMKNLEETDCGVLNPVYFDTDTTGKNYYIPRISGLTVDYTTYPDGVTGFEDEDNLLVFSRFVSPLNTKYFVNNTVQETSNLNIVLCSAVANGPYVKVDDTWVQGEQVYICNENKWKQAILYAKEGGKWYKNIADINY